MEILGQFDKAVSLVFGAEYETIDYINPLLNSYEKCLTVKKHMKFVLYVS